MLHCIYCDFMKAFEKVPHLRFLYKLARYGITDYVQRIKHFVTGHQQCATLNTDIADWLNGLTNGCIDDIDASVTISNGCEMTWHTAILLGNVWSLICAIKMYDVWSFFVCFSCIEQLYEHSKSFWRSVILLENYLIKLSHQISWKLKKHLRCVMK